MDMQMQPVIMKNSFQKGENALALYGHSKYQDYKAALGDDLILVPLPDMGTRGLHLLRFYCYDHDHRSTGIRKG